ncbi:MAG: hypothetical protein ACYCTE_12515, partial [Acidimicrobiales bacterium]
RTRSDPIWCVLHRGVSIPRRSSTSEGKPKTMASTQRSRDIRTIRRAQQKQAGMLPTYRFRARRIPNKRRQAERDACRTAREPELE